MKRIVSTIIMVVLLSAMSVTAFAEVGSGQIGQEAVAASSATADYEWQQTGSGTQYYAEFPSGYYTPSSLYSKYKIASLSPYENDTNKREVSTERVSWIYWHWTWRTGPSNYGYNFFIEDARRTVDGRDYQYFADFESAENYSEYDPNGHHDTVPGLCFYHWRNIDSDGSWWWFRLPIYKQTYIDYKKVYRTYDISDAVIDSTTDPGTTKISDNGDSLENNIVIRLNDKTLIKGTDYTVSYDKSIETGPVKVTIKGKGRVNHKSYGI